MSLLLVMQIQAHKIILSDKSHPHPILCLDGISSDDMAWIIQYLYVGEVSVPQSSLPKFLKVAKKLKCFGLNEEILPNLSHKWGTGTNEAIHQRIYMNKTEEQLDENCQALVPIP